MHSARPSFDGRVDKCQIDRDWHLTTSDLVFRVGCMILIVVPRYYLTDLASIPRWARWLISKTDQHIRASIVHDWLCETKVISRAAADGLFMDLLRADGLTGWKVWAMYFAVRAGAYMPGQIKAPAHVRAAANEEIRKREGFLP